jgi:hypothetical protein
MINYRKKYIKYRKKYTLLKNIIGSAKLMEEETKVETDYKTIKDNVIKRHKYITNIFSEIKLNKPFKYDNYVDFSLKNLYDIKVKLVKLIDLNILEDFNCTSLSPLIDHIKEKGGDIPPWLEERKEFSGNISFINRRFFSDDNKITIKLPNVNNSIGSIDNIGKTKSIGYSQDFILTDEYIEKYKDDEYFIIDNLYINYIINNKDINDYLTDISFSNGKDTDDPQNLYVIHIPTLKNFFTENPRIIPELKNIGEYSKYLKYSNNNPILAFIYYQVYVFKHNEFIQNFIEATYTNTSFLGMFENYNKIMKEGIKFP